VKLSTRGRYGARIMLDLASHAGNGPQSTRAIAKRTGISVKYLERIIARLAGAGLVTGSRGQSGGYRLALPPAEIRLSAILKTLEGSLTPVGCVDDAGRCGRAADCVTREIWAELGHAIWETLDAIRLSDMYARLESKRSTL
jgi:Rrf2 family transcriptional regulator, iron-sulfur cluster assembly transcription factor